MGTKNQFKYIIMGAVLTSKSAIGKYKNAREAFKDLQAEAQEEYGRDYYNGKINNVDLGREIKDFPQPGSKAHDKWFWKTLEDVDKGECVFIEIKGAELKRRKDRSMYKGKKGVRAFDFLFCAPN